MLIHILLTCQPIRLLETYPPQKQGFNSRHYYRKLMVNGSISLFLRRVYTTWKGSMAQLPLVLVYHGDLPAPSTDSPLGVPLGGPGVVSKLQFRSKLHVQELISSTLQLLVMPKTSWTREANSQTRRLQSFLQKTENMGNLEDVLPFWLI